MNPLTNGQQDIIKCIKTNRDRNLSGQVFFHYEGLRKNNDAMAIALKQDAGQGPRRKTTTKALSRMCCLTVGYDQVATLSKS